MCICLAGFSWGRGQGMMRSRSAVRFRQLLRERTHHHKDLHLLPKSGVSMENKSPAYGWESLAPLPFFIHPLFSLLPCFPRPSSTSAFPGVPPIHASQPLPFPLPPHIPPHAGLQGRTVGTLLCQPRARQPCLLWHNFQVKSPSILLYPSVNI